MPKYLIERDVPGASKLTKAQFQKIVEQSNCAIEHLPGYRWHQSYVAGDRIVCVHEGRNEEAVREHARRGGFPISRITEISAILTPATARPAQVGGG